MALPVYQLPTFDLFEGEIKEREPSFREQTRFQRLETVLAEEQQLRETPKVRKKRKADTLKGLFSVMQFVGGVLNLPGAAISGAAYQMQDKKPGFDAQEYLHSVFNFKDQASWRHVIETVSEQSETKDVWDERWAQVVGGLVLDILLDPTTYVGYGLVKGAIAPAKAAELAVATRQAISSTFAKTGLKNADRILEGTFTKILKKALKPSGMGFQAPFSKYVKPFGRVSQLGEQVKNLPIEEGVKKLLPFAKKTIEKPGLGIKTFQALERKAPRIAKGVQFFEKAFVPYKPSKEVQRLSIRAKNIVSENTEQLKAVMNRVSKVIPDEEGQRIFHGFMQDLGEFSYQEGELVDILGKKADLLTGLMKSFEKGEATPQRVGRILKQLEADESKAFVTETTQLMRKWLTDARKFKAGELKRMPRKLTTKQLFKGASRIYDEVRIKKMVNTIDDAGITFDDLITAEHFMPQHKTLSEAMEKIYPGMTKKQKSVTDAFVDEGRKLTDGWHDKELTTGKDLKYLKNYMVGTKGQYKGGVSGIPGAKQFFEFERKFPTTKEAINHYAPILMNKGYAKNWDEAIDLLRTGKAGEMGNFPQIIDTYAESMMLRGQAHHKFMARHEFMEGVKDYGAQIKGGPGAGFRATSAEELKGWVFPDGIADAIDNSMKILDDNNTISQFIKMHDKIMGWYKVMWTVVNPGFHLRNAYSNHFLGYMKDGVRYMNPGTHRDAARLVRESFKNIDAQMYRMLGKDLAGVTPEWMAKTIPNTRLTYREFFGEITGTGTIRRQWVRTELAEYSQLMKTGQYTKNVLKKINPAGTQSMFVRIGENLGSFNEGQARVASVLTGLKKINGDVSDVRRVANDVNDVFVNYRNLTDFERNVARRAIPFYSWMKQNLVNQVKFIFTMPGKYAAIPRIAQAISPRRTPEDLQPSYYKKLWMWELPITLPDGTPLFLNPNLPFQDLEKLNLRDIPRTLLTATTPFLKVPIELAPKKGYDIFRGAELERYPGFRAPVPGVLQTFSKFIEKKKPGSLKKLGIKNERGIYTMNPKAAHAMQQLIPPLNNISRATMQGNPTQDGVNKMFAWISYVFGIKIKPLDLIEMRHYRAQRELKARRESGSI